MWSLLLRATFTSIVLLVVSTPLHAEEVKSFQDEYDAIVSDFQREAAAARGDRRRLMDAKQRFDTRLEKSLQQIQASGDGSPAESDLIVAVAIAEQLSKGDVVVALCDQILRQNPNSDPAIFARLRGLIGLQRLDDAEQHVRQSLREASQLSDRRSMCGLLLGAFEQQGQWEKGLEYGSLFLAWCSRKIRVEGGIHVAVPSFIDRFAHCAHEADNSPQLDQIVKQMLGDVTAAIERLKRNQNAQGENLKQVDFLFQLKHHLCCLSPHDDPGACVVEWLAVLTGLADHTEPEPASSAIAKATGAAAGSLCLARDLDAIWKAGGDCRTALENRMPAATTQEPIVRAIAALKSLESMVEGERALRDSRGKMLDFWDKVDWHHKSPKTGTGPMVVYVWRPAGRDPGLTLRQGLSKLRETTTLPLVTVSLYNTAEPAILDQDAAAERQQKERAAVRRHAGSVSEEIAVGCIDGKLLSQKLPVATYPQVYLLGTSGKVEFAVAGVDRWRLRRLQVEADRLSPVGHR